jgi:ATP-binding cassette, subfamily B (MDR/TAP), member 1
VINLIIRIRDIECHITALRTEHGGVRMGKDDGPPSRMRPFALVFMHADVTDAVLMALGLLGAIGDGLSTPVMLFITSRIFNDLGGGPGLLTEFSIRMDEVE